MDYSVRSKIVKIGNSRGVRIPRVLLEQAGLTGEIEMKVEGGKLIIHSIKEPRQGWDVKFAEMAKNEDDLLLDEPIATKWDEEEWTW
jgi:antitoxin MazE